MPSPGDPLRKFYTAAWWTKVEAAIGQRQRLTISGPGYAAVTRSGLTISLPRQRPSTGGSGTTVNPPWLPFTSQDDDGNYQANFYPGTLGGIVASNIFTPLSLIQSAINYVSASISASGGVVTAVSLTAS